MRAIADVDGGIPLGFARFCKALHEQADALPAALAGGRGAGTAGAGTEPVFRGRHIAQRGGQANAPRVATGQLLQALEQAEHLHAAHIAHEGVHLVDDDVAQVGKQFAAGATPPDQQGLQRFGRDLQNALRVLEQAPLGHLGH